MKMKKYIHKPARNSNGDKVIDVTKLSVVNSRMGEVLIEKRVSGPGRATWLEKKWFPNHAASMLMGQ